MISNAEMARVFNEIADMLEISGELVYKAVAYRRVADAVERWPDDVAHLFGTGQPPKIPGAGPKRSDEVRERQKVPACLIELPRVGEARGERGSGPDEGNCVAARESAFST